jgi:fido (protein-threonine AMPylation protein)
MLAYTAYDRQENISIRRVLGRNYNEQHLHDMHKSLFGDLIDGSGTRREACMLAIF